ncbi:MAG: superfamily I DNA/RNA helicase [Planctomycetota bacterium]|jgi:superfamily I DNA/RNA helicase
MPHLLESLNPEQRRAAEAIQGPVLVLAGAGTGKTRVITYRMAHMLDEGIPPDQILAMTFTNKAAAEMRDRIGNLVGKDRAKKLTVGTFHSFCLHTLREYKEIMGWPKGFTICDPGDQLSVMKGALRELAIPEANFRPQDAISLVSLAKNRLQTPETFLARAADDKDELLGRVWERYAGALARSRRLDFDDLLIETTRLLRMAGPKKELAARFRYLLVDEYQDTNSAQFNIVKALAGKHRNLCVVGDDDQSIYSWRGADIAKILGFEKTFPGAVVVRLETNYRSTAQVIDVANRLIRHNVKRHDKKLISAAGSGEPIQAVRMRDEDAEAQLVVAEITAKCSEGHHHDDFAILFRTSIQARAFEAELRMKDVPYVLVGGLSFFDRKEVRDVLAYARLMLNPDDETSLLRIINKPSRGVGKTTLTRVLEFATNERITACEAIDRAEEIEGVNATRLSPVQRMRERLAALRELYPDKEKRLVDLVQRMIEEVAYADEVKRCYPDEAEYKKRWVGVEEVLNFAQNYVKRRKRPTLRGFLNELTLSANDSPDAEDAQRRLAVTLMTLHASKGLEFPRVFLVGMEEGILPHLRSAAEGTIDEERRLGYVGITRAEKFLQISWCGERAKGGRMVQRHPSRFLLEIQGKEPPEDWIAAGDTEPTNPVGRKKHRKKAKAARRRTGRR